jgi:hypothetical protein
VGQGGPGTRIYGVDNIRQARSLAQLLHWHEQPREAFHHRGGGIRSGVVALGIKGTSMEGSQLRTTLRVFTGVNATNLERARRVAISTLLEGQLCFQGFFRLVELGQVTGAYQEATFERIGGTLLALGLTNQFSCLDRLRRGGACTGFFARSGLTRIE